MLVTRRKVTVMYSLLVAHVWHLQLYWLAIYEPLQAPEDCFPNENVIKII